MPWTIRVNTPRQSAGGGFAGLMSGDMSAPPGEPIAAGPVFGPGCLFGPIVATDDAGRAWDVPAAVCTAIGPGGVTAVTSGPFWPAGSGGGLAFVEDEPIVVEG